MGICESKTKFKEELNQNENGINKKQKISNERTLVLENNNNLSNNYIISEIEIKEEDINKDIRIINSYEESARCLGVNILEEEEKNEEEIKKCEIKLNNGITPFNYFLQFKKEGKYTIKYSFKNYLTKTNYMFNECESITNIDLSNFKTQNVNDMSYMFCRCTLLKNIYLSGFNTSNVKNMSYMFCRCKSLIYLDLLKFNTQNVTNMRDMFSWCESLTNMDLSSFNTKNVTDMYGMFCGCKSLSKVDLSNFNTQNVTDMNLMFCGCKSLTNINLSNFNTQNVTGMWDMFSGCKSLKKENIITKDKRILSLKITKDLNKI